VLVRETRGHAELEASQHDNSHPDTVLTNRQIFLRTTITEPALSAASQAGLVNNLNFGLSWGLFPILFATTGMPWTASEFSSLCTRQCGASVNSS